MDTIVVSHTTTHSFTRRVAKVEREARIMILSKGVNDVALLVMLDGQALRQGARDELWLKLNLRLNDTHISSEIAEGCELSFGWNGAEVVASLVWPEASFPILPDYIKGELGDATATIEKINQILAGVVQPVAIDPSPIVVGETVMTREEVSNAAANHVATAAEQIRLLGIFGNPEIATLNPVLVLMIGRLKQVGNSHGVMEQIRRHASHEPAGSREAAVGCTDTGCGVVSPD